MTLTQLFTNIANAIRAKTGSSETIKAEDFSTEIANITTGHLDNTEYAEANDDLDDILEGSTPTKVYPPDWSEIGYEDTPQGLINDFNYAKEIYDNWDVSIVNINERFRTYPSAIFPKINTSQVTNMNSAFYSSSILRFIPVLDTSNVTRLYDTFSLCRNLSNESLNNILAMCINATSYTGTKTLKQIGLSSAQATTCQTLSNYQAFLDVGWTTGY